MPVRVPEAATKAIAARHFFLRAQEETWGNSEFEFSWWTSMK